MREVGISFTLNLLVFEFTFLQPKHTALTLDCHPFVVYTDHRNLEYLREAKRLNPRQARWPTSLPDSSSSSDTVVPGLGHRGCQCL